jgi:hypothetical protein
MVRLSDCRVKPSALPAAAVAYDDDYTLMVLAHLPFTRYGITVNVAW